MVLPVNDDIICADDYTCFACIAVQVIIKVVIPTGYVGIKVATGYWYSLRTLIHTHVWRNSPRIAVVIAGIASIPVADCIITIMYIYTQNLTVITDYVIVELVA